MKHAAAILMFLVMIPSLPAQDWTRWRGPHYDGTSEEHLAYGAEIVLNDPIWRRGVGEGSGTVVVAAGRVYATGWRNGEETVYCLNAADGSVEWAQSYRSPRYGRHAVGDQGHYAGPTATPVLDNDSGLLYTLGCDGDLRCWDAGNQGALRWIRGRFRERNPCRC